MVSCPLPSQMGLPEADQRYDEKRRKKKLCWPRSSPSPFVSTCFLSVSWHVSLVASCHFCTLGIGESRYLHHQLVLWLSILKDSCRISFLSWTVGSLQHPVTESTLFSCHLTKENGIWRLRTHYTVVMPLCASSPLLLHERHPSV